MVIADEMVARQTIIAASKRPQRFLALRSFVLDDRLPLHVSTMT